MINDIISGNDNSCLGGHVVDHFYTPHHVHHDLQSHILFPSITLAGTTNLCSVEVKVFYYIIGIW